MATDSTRDQAFDAWRREVSALCLAKFGVELCDLPDLRTRDAFDNDVSPAEFFREDVLPLMREEFGSPVDGR